MALGPEALKGVVVHVVGLVSRRDDALARRVIDHDVRVAALGQDALARIGAVQLGRIFRQEPRHLLLGDAALGHAVGIQQDAAGLHAGQTAGNLGKIVLSRVLLRQGEGAVVGGNGLNLVGGQGLPQHLLVAGLAQRRGTDVFGALDVLRLVIPAVIQQQIVGAGLHIDLLTPLPGVADFVVAVGGGQVDDDHGGLRHLRHFQQTVDGLSLQHAGTGPGMGGRRRLTGSLFLGDEGVDHIGVFAVDAGDAAVFFQLLQGKENVLVANHHGRIGQIHLKRGDALLEHLRDLADDVLVPVVDGHVKGIVAGGFAVGLFVPQVQAVLQALALVGTGKVDDHGGAAAKRCPAAGIKIVGGGGVADVQVKVSVGVDEAGKQQLAAAIDDLRVGAFQIFADLDDLFAADQKVCDPGAAACYDGTVFQ